MLNLGPQLFGSWTSLLGQHAHTWQRACPACLLACFHTLCACSLATDFVVRQEFLEQDMAELLEHLNARQGGRGHDRIALSGDAPSNAALINRAESD